MLVNKTHSGSYCQFFVISVPQRHNYPNALHKSRARSLGQGVDLSVLTAIKRTLPHATSLHDIGV